MDDNDPRALAAHYDELAGQHNAVLSGLESLAAEVQTRILRERRLRDIARAAARRLRAVDGRAEAVARDRPAREPT